MSLENKVQKHIAENQLFTSEHRLLIALSGGGDSMALFHLMTALGYSCEVAHVNFQLRGEASDKDEALVRKVCKDQGLVLHSMREDTEAYAVAHKCSVEMAARDIRYAFFIQLLEDRKLDYVLVAHHQDDVVETFFINLMRGTGLSGLSGMDVLRQRIMRPLLSCTHQELLSYLDTKDLPYCTDHTNYDTSILRNKLRHDIIPAFEERKPGFGNLMQRTLARLKESEKLVLAYAEEWREKYTYSKQGCLYIDKEALFNSASPSEVLYRVLQPYHFPVSVVDAISRSADLRIGAQYFSDNDVLTVDRAYLLVTPIAKDEDIITINTIDDFRNLPIAIEAIMVARADCHFSASNRYAYFDAELVSFPLTLRRWQQGDVFAPFGMQGKQKKVSDYFIDNKVSQPQKEAAWFLCNDDRIMWIVSYRSDERYKVCAETEQVLILKVL